MKGKKLFLSCALLAMVSGGLVGCGASSDPAPVKLPFSYSISLATGRSSVLYLKAGSPLPEDDNRLLISEFNKEEGVEYSYTQKVSANGIAAADIKDYIEVSEMKEDKDGKKYFNITPKKVTGTYSETDPETGEVTIKDQEIIIRVIRKKKSLPIHIQIKEYVDRAQDGYNWAADDKARTKALGKLEEYAMENFLTGISLFENGGYVKYSDRADAVIPATEYITGYGWGLLADGKAPFTSKLPGVNTGTEEDYYYQSASSSDPLDINAWDATGSQVSDLHGYISSSYWGTRLKSSGNDYEWYPVLAREGYDRPVRNEPENPTNLYTKWKIPVKTKLNGLYYNYTGSDGKDFDNRGVELEDYLTVFQALLTYKSQVYRGSELAGDTTYGIKGAGEYYRQSKSYKDLEGTGSVTQEDKLWNDMIESGDLGLSIEPKDKDARTTDNTFINIELVNPIDDFTAMYMLSSNLYSPIPRSFLDAIGGGDYAIGAQRFGRFPDGVSTDIKNNVISVGPYYLKEWSKNSYISFARDADWFECDKDPETGIPRKRYKIAGVRIRNIAGATENPLAIWSEFTEEHKLDSAGVPSQIIRDHGAPEGAKQNGGDSTFKLNVNSCTQEQWDKLFGPQGSVNPQPAGEAYQCKPWMSNKNFLKGLYWSINRKDFAKDRGVQPSFNYFSNAYLVNPGDPENKKSYNATTEHADAVSNFHNINPNTGEDDFGYSLQTAQKYFKTAIKELVDSGDISEGTIKRPTHINIHIRWMYNSDIKEYGSTIGNYFKKAFDGANGKVVLDITQEDVKKWDQVYTDYLMKGQFDLGFGAISGNTYNPLNFLEVLKTDNSSGFTLNWGVDTGKVDELNPIIFNPRDPKDEDYDPSEDKAWSFDGLWAAVDHGAVITQGRDISPIENGYLANASVNELYNGGQFDIMFNFVDVENAVLDVEKVLLYIPGQSVELNFEYSKTKTQYTITFTAAEGKSINDKLVAAYELDKEAAKDKYTPAEKEEIKHPFTKAKYGRYWEIEIRYTIRIAGSSFESSNTFIAYATKGDQDRDRN